MLHTKEIVEKLIEDWNIILPLYENETDESLKSKYKGMLEQITRTFSYKIREDVYENHSELIQQLKEIGIDRA
jgi:hypothetical protein